MGRDSLCMLFVLHLYSIMSTDGSIVCVCVFVGILSMCKAVKFHEHPNEECVNVYVGCWEVDRPLDKPLWHTHTPQPHYPLLRASWVTVTLKPCVFPTPISVC